MHFSQTTRTGGNQVRRIQIRTSRNFKQRQKLIPIQLTTHLAQYLGTEVASMNNHPLHLTSDSILIGFCHIIYKKVRRNSQLIFLGTQQCLPPPGEGKIKGGISFPSFDGEEKAQQDLPRENKGKRAFRFF